MRVDIMADARREKYYSATPREARQENLLGFYANIKGKMSLERGRDPKVYNEDRSSRSWKNRRAECSGPTEDGAPHDANTHRKTT